MNTLLLDVSTWDLCLDASRNIAVAQAPYALAQDVASAIKTFLGEVYFNTTIGVPYFAKILGQSPPVAVVKEQLIAAALTVPGVVSATVVLQAFDVATRTVTGQVNFVDNTGTNGTVSL